MSINLGRKIKVIVPISGGKDSQSCLKLALKEYPANEILGLFCDTQFEHPLTYDHIKWMADFYGVEIKTLTRGSVPEQIVLNKRFPSGVARFCTDRLKMRPSRDFYKELVKEQGEGFQVWLGMRSDESSSRAKRYQGKLDNEVYPPHEVLSFYPKKLHKAGVSFRLPIIEWSKDEVFDLLNGEENILYSMGSVRVGCFPCLASGDKSKEAAFAMDEFGANQKKTVLNLEKELGKSVWTSKGGYARNVTNTSPELLESLNEQDDLFSGCSICAI